MSEKTQRCAKRHNDEKRHTDKQKDTMCAKRHNEEKRHNGVRKNTMTKKDTMVCEKTQWWAK